MRNPTRPLLHLAILLLAACAGDSTSDLPGAGGGDGKADLPSACAGDPDCPGIVVSGAVLDAAGRGVEGVTVSLGLASYDPRPIGVTDAEGRYQGEFVYIPGAEAVRVTAQSDRHVLEPGVCELLHSPGHEEATCDFLARPRPGVAVSGRVTDPYGRGVAGVAILQWLASGPPEEVAVTDEEGAYDAGFTFIPGTEMVRLQAEHAAYEFAPDVCETIHYPGFEEVTCDFAATAHPGVIVSGRVLDAAGQGIPQVKIYQWLASGPEVEVATTDVTGAYVTDFTFIPGTEMVRVRAGGAPGTTFAPDVCETLHYPGFEPITCDFTGR